MSRQPELCSLVAGANTLFTAQKGSRSNTFLSANYIANYMYHCFLFTLTRPCLLVFFPIHLCLQPDPNHTCLGLWTLLGARVDPPPEKPQQHVAAGGLFGRYARERRCTCNNT